MGTRDLSRPLAGALLGAALAVFGPVGGALGWLGEAVGLYSHPIPYRANVGVLAYSEGRVEAQAHWSRTSQKTVCEDNGWCETGEVEERLDITVAEGEGAGTQRHAGAYGQFNPTHLPRTDHQGADWAGRTVYFSAYYTYCGPDSCFDRSLDPWSTELLAFDLEVDPLLQHATFRGRFRTWDDNGDELVIPVDARFESDTPLTQGGGSTLAHSAEPAPRAGGQVHDETTVGRRATATWDMPGFAPSSDGSGQQDGGFIEYAVVPASVRGEAEAPARPPCVSGAPQEICDL